MDSYGKMKAREESEKALLMIPPDRIKTEEQTRKHFDSEKIKEKAQSIREHGLLQPITVQKAAGDDYLLVMGERRFRSAKAAGLKEVPCVVLARARSKDERREMRYQENTLREGFTAIEKAQDIRELLSERDKDGRPRHTLDSVAKKRRYKDRQMVQRLDKLNDLSQSVKKMVEFVSLDASTACLIPRVPPKVQEKYATAICYPADRSEPLSSREANKLLPDFIRDLKKARFDKKDATILPIEYDKANERVAGGACTDCPVADFTQGRRTCGNPSCFDRKGERSRSVTAGVNSEAEYWQRAERDRMIRGMAESAPVSLGDRELIARLEWKCRNVIREAERKRKRDLEARIVRLKRSSNGRELSEADKAQVRDLEAEVIWLSQDFGQCLTPEQIAAMGEMLEKLHRKEEHEGARVALSEADKARVRDLHAKVKEIEGPLPGYTKVFTLLGLLPNKNA